MHPSRLLHPLPSCPFSFVTNTRSPYPVCQRLCATRRKSPSCWHVLRDREIPHSPPFRPPSETKQPIPEAVPFSTHLRAAVLPERRRHGRGAVRVVTRAHSQWLRRPSGTSIPSSESARAAPGPRGTVPIDP
jgi:hypothetical protein